MFNRLARGESAFDEEAEARRFVRLLDEVARRDGLSVLAWCLMSNHYHLALRVTTVALDRPMRRLQQRVTRGVNASRDMQGVFTRSPLNQVLNTTVDEQSSVVYWGEKHADSASPGRQNCKATIHEC